MVDHRGTLTPEEHGALAFLLDGGPADLGPRTEAFTVREAPGQLWQRPMDAGKALAAPRAVRTVRTVDARIARRLEGRGWVLIDAGGTVTARAHRLAKPLPGGPGDGNAVVCSCGYAFGSWADAEGHQAEREAAP